jgi:L-lactate dehydrogenase (cytochrome)
MKAASVLDYRDLARRRLPRFLFEHLDGGSYAELALGWNVADLEAIGLRQSAMLNVAKVELTTELFGRRQESR